MENAKTCKNCKYLVKHYFKDEFGRFKLIDGAAHCKNPSLLYQTGNKIIKKGAPCERFEPEKVNPQDDKKTVLNKLAHAQLLLSDVTRILNEDKT